MKRNYLAKVAIFALTVGIILPSTIAQTFPFSVSTVNSNEASDETPVIDVYDKDGNLIKNYTKEKIEKLSQFLVPNTLVGSYDNSDLPTTYYLLRAYLKASRFIVTFDS
ncbi:hypothetical protein FORC13_p117 (plasmid) [Bacillus cereus]|uniref:hypothetical protein n=1 Tax=Bacillus cereus group TaxID=86661 RepID=UPI000744ACC2|nr:MULTISPECIES: hypothetical protein [Bacillus cereus group]ALZ64602.1 hypothetical protein FORC13_p117 [Bacillus cereus]MEC2395194.1 hypothetical protein [Bacillus toyonensis]OTX25593.1 hypothetical protein BK717_32235 [Bacillus thuringiensis serovar malayensis]OUB04477.1 hypothetical protein BK709_19630 [Bacillus thuringiensis serovar shandongiensis]